MNAARTLTRPSYFAAGRKHSIRKASAELVAYWAERPEFDAFTDLVDDLVVKGVEINDAIAMGDRAFRSPVVTGGPQGDMVLDATGSGSDGVGVIEQFGDPDWYDRNMAHLEPEQRRAREARVEQWIGARWVDRRIVYRDGVRVLPLDQQGWNGRPSPFTPGVAHVIFVPVPKSDPAYRQPGEDSSVGGCWAALLVQPETYIGSNDGLPRASGFYRFDAPIDKPDQGATLLAVKFFRSQELCSALAVELRTELERACSEWQRSQQTDWDLQAEMDRPFRDDGAQAQVKSDFDEPF